MSRNWVIGITMAKIPFGQDTVCCFGVLPSPISGPGYKIGAVKVSLCAICYCSHSQTF